MRYGLFLLGCLGLASCEQEFEISDNSDAYGVDNPQG